MIPLLSHSVDDLLRMRSEGWDISDTLIEEVRIMERAEKLEAALEFQKTVAFLEAYIPPMEEAT